MPTNTVYTAYSQFANATITVTNTAELNAALTNLSSSGGGTILLDGNGEVTLVNQEVKLPRRPAWWRWIGLK